MKLYWATDPDSESWEGPFESEADAIADARSQGMGDADSDTDEIWIAPADPELDDEDAFFDALADHLLVWGVENAEETLVEDGWLDPDEGWHSGSMLKDRDRILANALRQVLGERPAWRCVDTAKARKVEL
jgi:hypothetical protein